MIYGKPWLGAEGRGSPIFLTTSAHIHRWSAASNKQSEEEVENGSWLKCQTFAILTEFSHISVSSLWYVLGTISKNFNGLLFKSFPQVCLLFWGVGILPSWKRNPLLPFWTYSVFFVPFSVIYYSIAMYMELEARGFTYQTKIRLKKFCTLELILPDTHAIICIC